MANPPSEEEGQASGASTSLRELGGFVDGLVPALWAGATLVGLGALVALVIPRPRPSGQPAAVPEPLAEAA